MPLNTPKLDDRTFNQLLAEAKQLISKKGSGWTDLSPSDPGIILLELFAYLTEVLLYRLNKVPEKVYIEFLNLLGVTLQPPAAASVVLTFTRSGPAGKAIPIPKGTRVTPGRSPGAGEPPIFTTVKAAEIPPDKDEVDVTALHCEQVDGELIGTGNGQAGQAVFAKRPPLIAPTGYPPDLVVGVEAKPEELGEGVDAIEYADKPFRIWKEVENYTNLGEEQHVYVVDRYTGLITFAPAVRLVPPGGSGADESPTFLAAVPDVGREIRLWYRRGGGPEGNIAEEKLTTLRDLIPGVKVTNRARANGGKAVETLGNALLRGPQELHSLQRAVTARDFELIARNASSRAVSRARAFTRLDLWKHASPGSVEVVLVPEVPLSEDERLTADLLLAHQSETIRQQIEEALHEREPLGINSLVTNAHYKRVDVHARVVVRREEDQEAVRQRILRRLYGTINPLPNDFQPNGWPFGQALRQSHVFDVALAEPGVRWVDSVRLVVDAVPGVDVDAVAVDYHQPETWYVGSGTSLFRSQNNGDGWELIGKFEGSIVSINSNRHQAGMLAIAVRLAQDNGGTQVLLSGDCGETWSLGTYRLEFNVNGMAWTERNDLPVLFLATDVGLYEITIQEGSSPVEVLVDPQGQKKGYYSVITDTDPRGLISVAVAAQSLGGVYLSIRGGRPNSFRRIPKNLPASEDIRVLKVQREQARAFLWAGTAPLGNDNGNGCYRWELSGEQDPVDGWVSFKNGWQAGSCKGLAFHSGMVYAATHHQGVVVLDPSKQNPQWVAPRINCGLPLREGEAQRLFYPVDTIAASPDPQTPVVMAGGVQGVYLTADGGQGYIPASRAEFSEKVTLPPAWLFVSGEHAVEVVGEDEAG